MTPELDQHIREKYPLIFSQPCELSVGDGWFDIIDTLCASIQYRIKNINSQRDWLIENGKTELPDEVEQVVATQIKEKFGTLRFYYYGGDEHISGLEHMAEAMSSRICEECGCPGTVRSTEKNRWVRVLCDKHAIEQGYYKDEDSISQ